MAHWLIKSEPSKWSWDQQVAAGAKGTHWDGVKNHTAKLNLMAMKQGEQVFFYHSNEGLEVVGIVEVIKEYYPDHTDPSGKFGMVEHGMIPMQECVECGAKALASAPAVSTAKPPAAP